MVSIDLIHSPVVHLTAPHRMMLFGLHVGHSPNPLALRLLDLPIVLRQPLHFIAALPLLSAGAVGQSGRPHTPSRATVVMICTLVREYK
jgi:hypothetical protein